MAYHTKLPIVTDGLIFSVDPYNTKSYVSGDTVTYNLVNNSLVSGTFVNGVGFNGESFVFGGTNEKINFGSASILNFGRSDELTFEAWVNPSVTTFMPIMGDRDVTTKNGITFFNSSGKLGVFMIGGIGTNQLILESQNVVIPNNEWSHVVFSKNTNFTVNVGKMYVNGTEIPFNYVVDNLLNDPNSPQNFHISGDGDRTEVFNGYLSYIKIYNKMLTDNEVKQNYNALKHRFV
jgi:hypothetical protein